MGQHTFHFWQLSAGLLLGALFSMAACGSDEGDGGGGGASSGGGGGGTGPTTCLDGYPKLGAACAIENELCKSCPTGAACCDEIRCQSSVWVMTQSHTACPEDAGADADDAASDSSADAVTD